MSAARESMTSLDLAWLRMERVTNPMMIVGVLTLDGRLGLAALRSTLLTRFLHFERFRQRPVHDALGTHWEADPHFDIDSHLHRLVLPPRARQAQLEAAVSDLASTPLDPRRPLWQFHLVERYGRGSALIVRLHHCYADGIALLRVMLAMTDGEPHPAHRDLPDEPGEQSQSGPGSLIAGVPLVGPALDLAQSVVQEAIGLLSGSLQQLAHPQQAVGNAKHLAAAGAELARMAALSEEPHTPLKDPLSARKQVAWAVPLPLADVKSIAHALGCTVNDILLSTVAGALGAYIARRGGEQLAKDLQIRALVPVNLRPPGAQIGLGNYFGLVFVDLPIGIANPLARVFVVHQQMQQLKRSPQAIVALWLLAAMGMLPAMFEERAIEMFTSKASLVISNVPGPQQPMYMAGARIDRQFFWVPQAGSIGTGVSMFTYNNQVHFGLIADRNLIPEPRHVVESFVGELRKLLLCAIPASGSASGSAPLKSATRRIARQRGAAKTR